MWEQYSVTTFVTAKLNEFIFLFLVIFLTKNSRWKTRQLGAIRRANLCLCSASGFGKSSWKHSKSFRIFLSNQKLARALTSTPKHHIFSCPKVIAPAVMLLSNFVDENRGLSPVSEEFRHQLVPGDKLLLVLVPPLALLPTHLVHTYDASISASNTRKRSSIVV